MGELRVEGLSKVYARREGWNRTRYLRVFEDVSFTVRDGEFVSIIGSSGCGKSTLLGIVGGTGGIERRSRYSRWTANPRPGT